MNILLEGFDGGGKSTLARYLAEMFNMTVQSSEGPPKYPGEIHDRIARYSKLNNTIFDRHPCVSQVIYGHVRGNTTDMPTADEVQAFYAGRPVLVYCRSLALDGHIVKDHDTPEHLAMVEQNRKIIIDLYDQWALQRANFIYRIGDSMFRMRAAIATWK